MAISSLAFRALAIFDEAPTHAYGVLTTLQQRREDRFVKLRPGSLYHAVSQLDRQGLIVEVGTERAGNRPERMRWQITDRGRECLLAETRHLVGTLHEEYPAFPLGLGELNSLTADEASALLRDRAEKLQASLDDLEQGWAAARTKGVPERFLLDVDYVRLILRTELDWVIRTAARIADDELDWTSVPPHHHPHGSWPAPHDAADALDDAGSTSRDQHRGARP